MNNDFLCRLARMTPRSIFALIFVVSCSAAAYADFSDPRDVAPSATLSLSSSAVSYPSSSDVRLQFAADNVGSKDIYWFPHPPPMSFDLQVTDAAGTLVNPVLLPDIGNALPGHPHPYQFAPGTHFQFTDWDGVTTYFSIHRFGYELAAPGTYYIRAKHRGWRMLSNTIRITLTGTPTPSAST